MVSPVLMAVPGALQAAVEGGTAQVFGALVKDVGTGAILGHLQPTSSLASLVTAANPAALAAKLGSQTIEHYQLFRIEQLLDSVKLISSVGAAASVVNVGVCLGGFALVLSALKKTNAKLDTLNAAVEKLGQREDAKLVAAMRVALERAEDAFETPPDERRKRWQHCEERLHDLASLLVALLEKGGLTLNPTTGTDDQHLAHQLADPTTVELLAHLLTIQRAHVEVLLCLGLPGLAARTARRTEDWLTKLPRDGRTLAIGRAAGRPLPSHLMARVTADSTALAQWIAAAESSSQQQAYIGERLEADGADSLGYVLQVRNTTEPKLLFYPASASTAAATAQALT